MFPHGAIRKSNFGEAPRTAPHPRPLTPCPAAPLSLQCWHLMWNRGPRWAAHRPVLPPHVCALGCLLFVEKEHVAWERMSLDSTCAFLLTAVCSQGLTHVPRSMSSWLMFPICTRGAPSSRYNACLWLGPHSRDTALRVISDPAPTATTLPFTVWFNPVG